MAINSLNSSAQQILQPLNLSAGNQEIVASAIAQYADPKDNFCDKIIWLVQRICNAVKAIFGMSDWQQASAILQTARIAGLYGSVEGGADTSSYPQDAEKILQQALAAQNGASGNISLLPPAAPLIVDTPSPLPLDQASIDAVLAITPQFDFYKIARGTPFDGTALSEMSVRPANLFFDAIGFKSTPVGGGKLFACLNPDEFVENIRTPVSNDMTLEFSASSKQGASLKWVETTPGKWKEGNHDILDLGKVYGHNTYRMSYKEIQDTLDSQKITCSSMLPKQFYISLKAALQKDGIVELPGNDANPVLMKNLTNPQCKWLITHLKANPAVYGFKTTEEANALLDLSIYQVGAMVVKTEDFRIFTDGNGQIFERQAGEQDGLRLINACGIRGIQQTPGLTLNTKIMAATFNASLQAAENGIIVFPAVGMGVWRGDPAVYWEAFFQAVASSGAPLQSIFVNPRHQKTGARSQYQGKDGSEFAIILKKYIDFYTEGGHMTAVANLQKIVNLYDDPKDVLQLAYNLKKAHPNTIVSIFNASDPDVTLGWHVGEYTNNRPHGSPTTEEHYTMMGTNGICWENMTGVHEGPDTRIIQAK